MQDTELYQHILGLESPWSVSEVNVPVGLPSGARWDDSLQKLGWFTAVKGAFRLRPIEQIALK